MPKTGRRLLVLVTFMAYLMQFSITAVAQSKYSPDHPDVEAMVNKAVAKLTEGPGQTLGEVVLSALAIVQARKRYYQEIPVDNAIVVSAIEKILAAMPEEIPSEISETHLLRMNEVYVPALAAILLAEVNDAKYKEPIKKLIEAIEKRQTPAGAINYLRDPPDIGDTSQTQYAALALYVVKLHGFTIRPESSKKMLGWLVESQQPTGAYHYKLRKNNGNPPWSTTDGQATSRLSIHVGGLGTAYLLADVLQLSPRKKSMNRAVAAEVVSGLPKSVTVYVKPIDGEDAPLNVAGALVSFDMGGLNGAYQAGNRYFASNFDIVSSQWTFYYLYALERYAWFREQSEGDLGNDKISQWYDTGVEYLKKNQQPDGLFHNPSFGQERPTVCTAFAILFLVRSSEVISSASLGGDLTGSLGFPTGPLMLTKNGELVGSEVEKDLATMIDMLQKEPTPEQLEALTKSLKNAVVEFQSKPEKSRGEIKAFLRTMISDRSFYRRKIAIRFLAGEQDMDNVPALIYALGDPNLAICLEAHDGLRLISRKIDSLSVTDETRRNTARDTDVLTPAELTSARLEFDALKKAWTEWFVKIRPDAELLD